MELIQVGGDGEGEYTDICGAELQEDMAERQAYSRAAEGASELVRGDTGEVRERVVVDATTAALYRVTLQEACLHQT